MCGCSSCATVRASRTNRTASDGEGVRPRSMTLTATSRFNGCSRTRNTAANPPSPSRSPTVNSFPRACCRRRRSVTVSSDMTDAKPRNARRLALGIVGAALVWLLGVWPTPVWWRDHWPRETAMMREGRPEGWNGGRLERSNRPTVQPTALKDISPLLQRMVIIGEDSRFRTHHGIDPAEIGDALGLGRRKDAWGTNVASTLKALESFPGRIVLIAGGKGKGQAWEPLAAAARGRVAHALLIGEDAKKIGAA